MGEKIVRSENRLLSASETICGWVVSGQCQSDNSVHLCLKTETVDIQTQDLLTMFWKVEDTSSAETTHTKNEEMALDHFGRTRWQIYSRTS